MNSVPIITILNLTTLKPYFSSSPADKPWHAVAPAVYSQIMLNLSIITACIPSLKRFLQDLQSGVMAVNITESFELGLSKKVSSSQPGAYATVSGTGFASMTPSKLGGKSQTRSNVQTTGHDKDDVEDLKDGYGPGDGHSFSQGHNNNAHKFSTQGSTVERSDSVKGLTDGVIYRSVDFKVEYEGRSSEGSGSRPSPPHDATWHDTRNEEGDRISDYDIRK
jgi:hypothetical protein